MKVARVFTGDDGRSHFGEIELSFEAQGEGAAVSTPIPVGHAVFRKSDQSGHELIDDFHTASKRLLVIKLEGQSEIEVGDGAKRVFGPGDVHILEDLTGEGHRGRLLSERSLTLILELSAE